MNDLMPGITEKEMAEPTFRREASAGERGALPRSVEIPPLTAQQQTLVAESMTARLDYVPHDLFEQAGAEQEFFGQGTEPEAGTPNWYPLGADPATARHSIRLTPEQERLVFLKYNYARKRAQAAVQACHILPSDQAQRQAALWYGRVRTTCDTITRANLALVLSMGKRMRNSHVDFDELVSEGNMALIRALEKFDVSRGFKFSTYACRAIVQSFGRLGLKNRRYHRTFSLEFTPDIEKSNQSEWLREDAASDAVEELRRIIGANKARLSAIEKRVIRGRFAINCGADAVALTLEQMGRDIGLTRERVRQIQNQALAKLRLTIENANNTGNKPA